MRPNGLTITLTNLGDGEVVRVRDETTLLPRTPNVAAPLTPAATNLRFTRGLAQARPGYKQFADNPDTDPVNGLFQAVYSNGTTDLVRCDKDKVRRYNAAAWVDITGAAVFTATSADAWCFGMVRNAGAAPANQLFLCNGVDEIYTSVGGGTNIATVGAATITGARAIVGHKGRALFGNVKDSGSNRRDQRVHYSIVGDPENVTGTGSGFVDLDEDAFPIAAAAVVAGNVCMYKGGTGVGGSLVIGTPTGLTNTPYRWDTLSGHSASVGIVAPRTLQVISPSLAFYLGHDAFYLHDGARGVLPVAQTIAEDIVSRLSYSALSMAVAWYKPRSGEIHVAIPTGGSSYANEVWVLNLRDRHVFGPYQYTHAITAAAAYVSTGSLTWDTLPVGLTWDTLPYATWDTIGGSPSAQATILGTSTGQTVEDNDVEMQDLGTPVTGTYETAPITFNDLPLAGKPLSHNDVMTLHDVAVIYKDRMSWVPVVEVSTDGGVTWTEITAGATIGAGDDRIKQAVFTTNISSVWFKLRVRAEGMYLSGLRLEFTHAGNIRND